MLTQRRLNIITFLLVAGLLLYSYLGQVYIGWWWYLIILLAYSGGLVYGAMRITAGFFLPVTCNVPTKEKVIAITFDDGPLPQYTPAVLDILEEAQVPAAFFCIGKHAAANTSLLQRIHAAGHVIGNHSFTHHFWFDLFAAPKMLLDMQAADQAVEAATGLRPRLFRPPYGVTNPNLAKAIRRGQYVPVGWNIRSLDTVATDKNALLQRILNRLQPGSILLLHDTCAITVELLPELITQIQARGYTIERLDKLINTPSYA
ncbi:Peptidoglycan/xylan/chitin deacetylase, PgdA/CDA1 family [Chitinophaga costaii]|uniref:Peptidoglycan/xylan/chitin deacetylase, PgdA/CDA1 family n=1 Tax=Chitinophaga costaii TaxID=1335309 RepID=A0A1C3ZGZ5_9BACT|nr:polysaccharide deacetylase family protein [Chitinophaga costaii]PUZ30370.1 polysaccharide deacetylase family protein [Chitinophaga costaii]SCB81655.1 Peptidoglycan/xylan/chitin deacetylase, PgdA/CDA1 family [Chitinophaga costaii]